MPPSLGPVGISSRRFLASKTSPCAIVWRCVHDPRFNIFCRTQTCDKRKDGWTDTMTAYTALARRCAVKIIDDGPPPAWQVAQLSLTNPRDALHHGKRKILKQSRDHNHALLWAICPPVARIDIAYLCTKFDDFKFSRSSDMIGIPKFLIGYMTWPRPYEGRFIVHRLWLAHSTPTSNSKPLR